MPDRNVMASCPDPTAAECERDPWAAEGKVEERVTSGEPGARDGTVG